ncbi:MAG TPA: FtsX-like permease family protein [Patescibacteria group bacterium]|nr:FtsX-like permease family protein [Patescibacteria group bacterium]
MKIADTIKRSGRNLRAAKLRTLLTAIAISVGGFTLTITLAASVGAHNYTNSLVKANFDPKAVFVAKDKTLFNNSSGDQPQLYSTDLATGRAGTLQKQLNTQDLDKIKALPHVTQVLPSYNLTAQFVTRPGADKYTGAINVYDSAQKPLIKAGQLPDNLSNSQVLLPDTYLSLLKFNSAQAAVGQSIIIQVHQLTGKTMAQTFTIAAVTTKSTLSINLDPVGPYVSVDEAGQLDSFINGNTVLANLVPAAIVRGDGSVTADQLKSEVTKAGFEARTAQDLQQFINQIVNVLGIVIAVFGLITLVASFFGVVNTQYISVLERTREIGLMKALGMSRRTVSRLFMIEATWIGFIGAAMGAGMAVLLGTLLNPWISRKINFGSEHLLIFKPAQIIALIIFLMLVTTVAGLLPARKAAKLDPIEALRTE